MYGNYMLEYEEETNYEDITEILTVAISNMARLYCDETLTDFAYSLYGELYEQISELMSDDICGCMVYKKDTSAANWWYIGIPIGYYHIYLIFDVTYNEMGSINYWDVVDEEEIFNSWTWKCVDDIDYGDEEE